MHMFIAITILITIAYCDEFNGEHEVLKESPPCYSSGKKLLEIFPGNGWDSLQNQETKPIFERKYTQCISTSDGQYIIPDNSFSVLVQSSNLNTESETLRHWKDYSDITAKTISSQAQFRVSTFDYGAINIAGTYSAGYTKLKEQMLAEKVGIYRTQARYTKYTVEFHSNQFHLDQHFYEAIQEIASNLKHFGKAKLLTQFLIRDYGTHCITKVNAGAIVVIEKSFSSQTGMDKLLSSSSQTSSFTSGYNFFELVKFFSEFEGKSNRDVKSSTYKFSLSNRTTITNYGGKFLNINECRDNCLVDWLNTVPNNLATIDRDGKPLHFLLLPEFFPSIKRDTLGKVSELVKATIDEYYMLNTHFGCMDPVQINFNFNANVQDGSCNSKNYNQFYNFTFNGIYQTCAMNITTKNVEDICKTKSLIINNPFTGDLSCPLGTSSVSIYTGLSVVEICTRKWYKFWKKQCELSIGNVETFWCNRLPLGSNNSRQHTAPGILFGGMYSKSILNPITSDESCPPNYKEIKVFNDATFCIGMDHNNHNFRNSLLFGGMFSCKEKNPLGNWERKSIASSQGGYSCPEGYSQQMVTNMDDCYIFYCLQFHSALKTDKLKIKLPPFDSLTELFLHDENSDVNFIDREKYTGLEQNSVSDIWFIMTLIIGSCAVVFVILLITFKVYKMYTSNSVSKRITQNPNCANELFEHFEKKQYNCSVNYGKVEDEEYLNKVSL